MRHPWTPKTARAVLFALVLALVPASSALGATRQVSPSGSDSGACTGTPCRTINYAYKQAAPGDQVLLASGAYGNQTLTPVAGRGAPNVEVAPAAGATVSVNRIDASANNVTVRALKVATLNVENAAGVVLTGVDVTNMYLGNTTDLVLHGSSIGPYPDHSLLVIAGGSNLTIDSVSFHDALATMATTHTECIWVSSVDGFTVRNSSFSNCAYFDIFFTAYMSPPPKNVLLENNVFEQTKTYGGSNAPYSVMVSDHVDDAVNYTFRNNLFETDIALISGKVTNMKLANNIGASVACVSGATFTRNVWSKGKCGATDKTAANVFGFFADRANHNWRLRAGSPAIDFADPATATARDRDGYLRLAPPDAGPHEFGAGPDPSPSAPAPTSTPQPPGGSKPSFAKLSPAKICVRKRKSCTATVATLTVKTSGARRVRARIDRIRPGHRARVVRSLSKTVKAGKRTVTLKIRARSLSKGLYRLTVITVSKNGKKSKAQKLLLRVR